MEEKSLAKNKEKITEKKDESVASAVPDKVGFDYIKSNQYQDIFIDGVHGGLTPRGKLQMSIFTERNSIPKHIVHKLSPEGKLGEEIKEERVARKDIIRDVESTLIMDSETALSIYHWLGDNLKKVGNDITQKEEENK